MNVLLKTMIHANTHIHLLLMQFVPIDHSKQISIEIFEDDGGGDVDFPGDRQGKEPFIQTHFSSVYWCSIITNEFRCIMSRDNEERADHCSRVIQSIVLSVSSTEFQDHRTESVQKRQDLVLSKIFDEQITTYLRKIARFWPTIAKPG